MVMTSVTDKAVSSYSVRNALQEPKPEGGLCSNLEVHALLETTGANEADREDEDAGVGLLVKGTEAELAAKESAAGGLFSPPRDGDCLMRCAVEHDVPRSTEVDRTATALCAAPWGTMYRGQLRSIKQRR